MRRMLALVLLFGLFAFVYTGCVNTVKSTKKDAVPDTKVVQDRLNYEKYWADIEQKYGPPHEYRCDTLKNVYEQYIYRYVTSDGKIVDIVVLLENRKVLNIYTTK